MTLLAEQPFRLYGTSHWAVLALFVGGAILLVLAGRSRLDTSQARRDSRIFALVLIAFQLPMQIYVLLPSQWGIGHSLPLQLSDLAWLSAAYALWTHRWWALALTYYWNITLTPQALFTPALQGLDFPDPGFVMFWGQHCLVVWAAIYLTWGIGLTPTWRSYRFTLLATAGWAAIMMTFNAIAGTNYGFLNEKPAVGSLLNFLGGWPWYVPITFGILALVWAGLTWPWEHLAAKRKPAVTH